MATDIGIKRQINGQRPLSMHDTCRCQPLLAGISRRVLTKARSNLIATTW
jgi:hypothetical protein